MKRIIKAIMSMGIIILGVFLAGSAFAAEVVQGKCIEYNEQLKIVKIQEFDTNFTQSKYGNPTTIESMFDLSKAKIGKTPAPGNILRIAYVAEGNKNVAIKVMNVSKQDIMKK